MQQDVNFMPQKKRIFSAVIIPLSGIPYIYYSLSVSKPSCHSLNWKMPRAAHQPRIAAISSAHQLHSKFYWRYILSCSPPSISPTGR